MAETLRHDDFGEKIGGAKKDLWRKNGLLTDDLSDIVTEHDHCQNRR